MRIVLTGGGTGGHLIPFFPVIEELKRQISDIEIRYFGEVTKNDAQILLQSGIPAEKIFAGKLRRYFSLRNFLDLFILFPTGFMQSLWKLFWYMPDVVFSKGGYGSIPVVLVAFIYRIPVLLHDSDAIPGIANRFLGKFATLVALGFHDALEFFPKKKSVFSGNPVRKEIIEGSVEEARKVFHLQSNRPILFVMGGSQGAQPINKAILKVLPQLLEGLEIIHQCGERNFEKVKNDAEKILKDSANKKFYHLYSFIHKEIKHAYKIATIVLARAGAGTLSEIAATGSVSIIVPLPHAAANHQRANANVFQRYKAAIICEEENLTPHLLPQMIYNLLNDEELREEISVNVKKLSSLEAASFLADIVIKLGKKFRVKISS